MVRSVEVRDALPGLAGTLAFFAYAAWNVAWLAQGRLPPSILLGVFGVPAPTTGMTRSTFAMLEGDWSLGFLWNPLTLPFLALLGWTAAEILAKLAGGGKLVLSRPVVAAWALVLAGAWIAKWILGPQWW